MDNLDGNYWFWGIMISLICGPLTGAFTFAAFGLIPGVIVGVGIGPLFWFLVWVQGLFDHTDTGIKKIPEGAIDNYS